MEKLYIFFYKEKEKVFLWIPKLLKLKDKHLHTCYKQCYHNSKRKPNNERNNRSNNDSLLPEEGGHDVMS